MEWKGKIVLITGASTGIGQATLQWLHQKGCIVYNLDIAPPASNEGIFMSCDMRDSNAVREAVGSVIEMEKRIDMLFANAGIHLFAGIEETNDEQLDNIIRVNILGVWTVLQAVLPYMKKQNKGAVVLMGSDQSLIGKANSAAYGMTKGAIGQLAKSTAIDYAKFNIRVNCICPGTIDTPLLEKAVDRFVALSSQPRDKVMGDLKTVQPAGRIGKPSEIAAAVAFLLSDESSFITGSLLSADGGYVCQ